MKVTAYIRERRSGARDEPEPASDLVHVEAATYEDAQEEVRSMLPGGWIVASWRVDR